MANNLRSYTPQPKLSVLSQNKEYTDGNPWKHFLFFGTWSSKRRPGGGFAICFAGWWPAQGPHKGYLHILKGFSKERNRKQEASSSWLCAVDALEFYMFLNKECMIEIVTAFLRDSPTLQLPSIFPSAEEAGIVGRRVRKSQSFARINDAAWLYFACTCACSAALVVSSGALA